MDISHPLAVEYCSVVDVDFSLGNMTNAIDAGAKLMIAVGGYANASRQIQELQMREKSNSLVYSEANRHRYAAIAQEVEDISRLGVAPKSPNTGPRIREKGLLRRRQLSLTITESLWGDIRSKKACAVDTQLIHPEVRVEFTPTMADLKRKPCRPFSDEFRTISDLRRTNHWVGKADTFPALVPGVELVIERIVALKMRYPGVKYEYASET